MSQRTFASASAWATEDSFQWLRVETLSVLLVTLAAIHWVALIPYLQNSDHFWPGWGEHLALLVVIAGSFTWRRSHYVWASALFIGSLVIQNVWHLLFDATSEHLMLFFAIPIVLIAGTLLGGRAAGGVAIVVTLASLVPPLVFRTSFVAAADLIQALGAMWLSTLTFLLTTRNLYTTVAWLTRSQEEESRHLDEVQRHRGDLAASAKQLADATYRLEQMNHQLNLARLEAEEARRLKAQFAAHVSHELRTPINIIVGFSDLMVNSPRSYGDELLPAAFQADIETVHRSAKHLQGLIDDILDLSQLDAKEMPLLRTTVDLAAIVTEAASTIQPLLDRKQLFLRLDVAPDVSTAFLDPLRMRQVLLNLLGNAARHTKAGGVTVQVRPERDNLVISISDTGQGIDPREIPHLFDPFYRVAPSDEGSERGWGLGLAICKQFIELQGGAIAVESTGVPGLGTTFTVTMPTRAFANESRGRSPSSRRVVNRLRAVPSSPSVVVQDRDPYVLSLFRRHLTGYQIEEAEDDAEAVRMATLTSAHAILTSLPLAADHAEWHQRWLSLAQEHGVRVIGCPVPSGHKVARMMGLVDFLVKPVTQATLLATLERAKSDGRTVAIIDDEPAMVRLLARMLRSSEKPYRVLRAYDGQEGLELIRRARPDIVLTDLMMPHVEGLSLIQILKSDPDFADVAVVVVSAKGVTEVLPTPDARILSLITNRGLTVAEMLNGIQGLLDCLPPPTAARARTAEAPRAAPAEAPVSG